jgi:hypothetical protein
MAVIGVSYDAGLNTNKSLLSSLARGKKQVTGTLNFSNKTYITGGVTTNLVGLSTVDICYISSKEGMVFEYDYSSTALVKVMLPGKATNTTTVAAGENAMQEFPAGHNMSLLGTVRFFASGR